MMLPARKRAAALAYRRLVTLRSLSQHSQVERETQSSPSQQDTIPTSEQDAILTGAAKLYADALLEEAAGSPGTSSRDHLVNTQGPIWTGDEAQADAVLRMLVDKYKPLRTGDGVKWNSSDEKIKGWMKGLKLEPRLGPSPTTPNIIERSDDTTSSIHRTTIPPHLHRPWHSTYTGHSAKEDSPKIKYGTFIRSRATADDLTNILELQIPANADAKTKARLRAARKAGKVVRRFDKAREGALDYKLGLEDGELLPDEGDEDQFRGNRQVKGSSVLGGGKGGASGLRAWAGLVEDRIQRAREAGFLTPTKGLGKPIPRDPEAGNPHLETGELLMNRIVKRQGALPPWIELQNSLDSSLNAFRSTLLSTYTTQLVRNVMSSTTLHPLPPLYAIPGSDEVWEARERKFHEENIRQINDLVRKMNAQAPSVVRRGLVTLDLELAKVRGDVLRDQVWREVKRRAEEVRTRPPERRSVMETGLGTLRNATSRSLSTLVSPLTAVMGRGTTGSGSSSAGDHARTGGEDSQAGRDNPRARYGALIAVGLGVTGIALFRRPLRNDSGYDHSLMPVQLRSRAHLASLVASSPSEVSLTPLRSLQVYILEPILTFFRFLHLAILFGPVILTAPMLFVGAPPRTRPGKPVHAGEESWGAVWWYGFLVKQMERAGPSFIKLGQWAASRADLFPASLCDKMSKLHSNGHPHSLRHTKIEIERSFGMRFEDIFEEFGETPIGCGAIAQVYKAKLKAEILGVTNQQSEQSQKHSITEGSESDAIPSTSVAIKVLHPRVHSTIRRDIAIMSLFANALNLLPGMVWLSLPEEVDVFGEMMNSQLDLRVESANLDKFDRNFAKRGRRVTFPRPIRLGGGRGEVSGDRGEVMIEEYEDALPLKWFLRNGGGPYDDKIANIGLDAFLEMLLLDNWTHGDLHPGNIMVRFYKPNTKDLLGPLLSRFTSQPPATEAIPTQSQSANDLVHTLSSIAHEPEAWHARLADLNAQGYEPQLIFIDAGLVTTLDTTNRKNFLDLFQAIAEFDGYRAGKLMVERCRTPEHVIDEETFALKIQHLVLSVKSKTFSLAKIKISDILTDVLTAVRQHHVKMEGDFVNTVISILLLEGIGRQLDPDMDLFKSALPILRQLGRQMGTREAISAVPKGNIWAMAKLWIWMEAREVAGEVSAIDEWLRYDRLTPSI